MSVTTSPITASGTREGAGPRSETTAREEEHLMQHYQDLMVAQSMAAERERELQQQLRQRQHGAARRRQGRHVAVAGRHSLRARLAHIWALSH